MHKLSFGAVIKKIRLERGFTQEMLASHSGLERTFVSMLERGVKQPSLKTVSSLARAVGMKNYELLRRVEQEAHAEPIELPLNAEGQGDQACLDDLASECESARIGEIANAMPIIFFARTPMPEYAATFVSKNISKLFGYDRNNFMQHSGFWHEHIHADDLPKVLVFLQTMEINKVVNHEYRFLTESGEWLLVHEELKLIANESGMPKEVIGSIVSVSKALS